MNNLPDNFNSLLTLLREIVAEATDEEFRTFDAKIIGERVEALIEQYDAKDRSTK